ncbi:MAG: helix-turn-helix transcriptional regulator [Bdellovibrionales bacterium]
MSTKKHYTVSDLEKEYGPLTFGNSLEAYRLGEELTQKQFAKKLGISPQSLCDLEKGRRIPSLERAAKIAKKLNESAESWIGLVISDMVREADLDLTVEVKKASGD